MEGGSEGGNPTGRTATQADRILGWMLFMLILLLLVLLLIPPLIMRATLSGSLLVRGWAGTVLAPKLWIF